MNLFIYLFIFVFDEKLFLIHEKLTIQTSKSHDCALNGRHFV